MGFDVGCAVGDGVCCAVGGGVGCAVGGGVGCAVGGSVGCAVGGGVDGQVGNSHPALMSLVTIEPSRQVLVSSEHDGQERKTQPLVLMSRPKIVPSGQSILSFGFTPSGHTGEVGKRVGCGVGPRVGDAVGALEGEGVENCLGASVGATVGGHSKYSHVALSRPTKELSRQRRTSSRVAPGGHAGVSVGATVGHAGNSHVLRSRSNSVPSKHTFLSFGQRPGRRFMGSSVGGGVGVEVVAGVCAEVGSCDGEEVGTDVGTGVGTGVDTGVGTGVGVRVGAGVSSTIEFPPGGSVTTVVVGRGVETVGTGVGSSVGMIVGVSVGLAVGK